MWLLVILADAALKGVLIVALAAALAAALCRSSAAARHVVWSAALACLVALPALSVALPSWQAPVLPRFLAAGQAAARDAIALPPAPADAVVVSVESPAGPAASPASPSAPAQGASAPWMAWAAAIWAIGALAVLTPWVLGTLAVRRLARGARPPEDPSWETLLRRAAADLDLARRVRLLASPRVAMPMVWGILRPVILLPQHADAWPAHERRAVLLHELAHVKRLDGLMQLVGRAACALYWFNPLVHLAAGRQHDERERACDDRVLAAGQKASDYAAQLLSIAQQVRRSPLAAVAAVAMARPSRMEGRLLAILDATRSRRALSRAAALATVLLAAAVAASCASMRVTPAAGGPPGATSRADAPLAPGAAAEQEAATPAPASVPPARGTMLLLETRIIEVPADERGRLDQILTRAVFARADDPFSPAALMSEDQAAAFLEALQGLNRAAVIAAPKVVVGDDQEAQVSVGVLRPVSLPLVEDRTRKATAMCLSGIRLAVRAKVTEDPGALAMTISPRIWTFGPKRADVEGFVQLDEAFAEVQVTVPSGQWVALHAPPVARYRLTAIRSMTVDPKTRLPDTQFEREAVDGTNKDAKAVFILVKWKIATEAEVEQVRKDTESRRVPSKTAPAGKNPFDVRNGPVRMRQGSTTLQADPVTLNPPPSQAETRTGTEGRQRDP